MLSKKNQTPAPQVAATPRLSTAPSPSSTTPELDTRDKEIKALRAEIRTLKGKAAKPSIPVLTNIANITTLDQTSLLGLVQTLI